MPRTNMCKPRVLVELETELRGEYPKMVNKSQVKDITGIRNYALIDEFLDGLTAYRVGKRLKWKIEDVAQRLYECRVG